MKVINEIKNQVEKIMDNDSAHDFEHVMTLLHDIVSYPKSDKRSKLSSIHSAKKSKQILKKYDFSNEEIIIISNAIRDHSFSQNKVPATLEGKILQDADRLDAIGAIGIARVFATGGSLKRPFYNTDDPFCKTRKPDDKTWTVDHFYEKLLNLESLMNTKSGKMEAKKRTKILKNYLKQLKQEI
jgi:uncharacterized protein